MALKNLFTNDPLTSLPSRHVSAAAAPPDVPARVRRRIVQVQDPPARSCGRIETATTVRAAQTQLTLTLIRISLYRCHVSAAAAPPTVRVRVRRLIVQVQGPPARIRTIVPVATTERAAQGTTNFDPYPI